jgi:hypothetical protein
MATGKQASFAQVLDAADQLPLDDQESLAEILHRRVVERRREELAREVQQARREFARGGCASVSAHELMSEILG